MENTLGLLVLVAVSGAVANIVFIGMSIPLVRGTIRPNRLYGVRTPRTLSDEKIWYPANAYGGKALILAACVSIVLQLLLLAIATTLPPATRNASMFLLLAIMVACFALPTLIAAIVSIVHVRKL